MNKKFFGFSLIELIVVIAIIGLLAGIATPVYSTYTKRAKVTNVVNTHLTLIRDAVARYYTRYGTFPTNDTQLCTSFPGRNICTTFDATMYNGVGYLGNKADSVAFNIQFTQTFTGDPLQNQLYAAVGIDSRGTLKVVCGDWAGAGWPYTLIASLRPTACTEPNVYLYAT